MSRNPSKVVAVGGNALDIRSMRDIGIYQQLEIQTTASYRAGTVQRTVPVGISCLWSTPPLICGFSLLFRIEFDDVSLYVVAERKRRCYPRGISKRLSTPIGSLFRE